MAKITGLIIMLLAVVVAIFCIILKIKIPEQNSKKTLKARFLVTVSIMMAFFMGHFTSCKPIDEAMGKNTSTPTATYGPEVLCYIVAPMNTPSLKPSVTPNIPKPLCYTVAPVVTPSKTTKETPLPNVTCYKPFAPTVTPTNSIMCYMYVYPNNPTPIAPPTIAATAKATKEIPLCYSRPVKSTPTSTPLTDHPTCYMPVAPDKNSLNIYENLPEKKLAILEGIRKRNIIKEEIIEKAKRNIMGDA